jgi:hypothetical protein
MRTIDRPHGSNDPVAAALSATLCVPVRRIGFLVMPLR